MLAAFGLDGRRPLRPFKPSFLTTAKRTSADVTLGWAGPDQRRIWVGAALTVPHHAHGEALLEAAELASIPPSFVHGAVLVCQANIRGIFLNCALR